MDVLVEEQAAVRNPGLQHAEREEEESEDGLPNLHLSGREHRQDEIQPDVGEHAPGGGDEKHPQVLYLAGFVLWHHVDADRDDDKHVERGAAHNGAGAQSSSLKVMADHFNDGQQDLWRRRAQGHQGQVRYRLVPDAHGCRRRLTIGLLDGDLLFLRGDDLDRRHEAVRDDGHSQEHVDEGCEVNDGARHLVTHRGVLGVPHGQHHAIRAVIFAGAVARRAISIVMAGAALGEMGDSREQNQQDGHEHTWCERWREI